MTIYRIIATLIIGCFLTPFVLGILGVSLKLMFDDFKILSKQLEDEKSIKFEEEVSE